MPLALYVAFSPINPGARLYSPSAIELPVGCALTFASEAKFEIEAKISFRLEAKKKPDFT
jgi:hypothetical protein